MQIDGGDIILLEMPACPLKAEVIAMTSPSPRELDKGLNVYFFAVARASSCIKCIQTAAHEIVASFRPVSLSPID